MERIVDFVAPSSFLDFILKTVLLVGCFTAVDTYVMGATKELTSANPFAATLKTFLIGLPFGLFTMGVMATQRRLKDELRYLSETDVLTGLLNRAAFIAKATAKLDGNCQVAVLMVDVDHFKSINDTHGHYAGDITLAGIGDHLRSATRHTDVIGRIGGEEFAILTPNADLDTAICLSSRICAKLWIEPTDEEIEAFQVTLSVGVAMGLPEHRLIDLMRFADQALYREKTAGRDQVVFHQHQATHDRQLQIGLC